MKETFWSEKWGTLGQPGSSRDSSLWYCVVDTPEGVNSRNRELGYFCWERENEASLYLHPFVYIAVDIYIHTQNWDDSVLFFLVL